MSPMRLILRLAPISLLIAISAGCKPSDDEQLTENLDAYVAEFNEQVAVQCDCWQELGYATQMACTDTGILPSRRRCVEDAFAEDVTASNTWMDCVLPLQEEYTTCINDRITCDNFQASRQPCDDDYNLGYMECVGLPMSVQRDYDNCFPD
jgi:hypothetical protein